MTTRTAYFDTHSHLQDPAFDDDRDAVLANAVDAGVDEIVAVASSPADAVRAEALAVASAGRQPRVHFTAGLHPHEASRWSDDIVEEIGAFLDRGAVAVGETGLDYHYDNSPRDLQRAAFERQLQLARERDRPVVVHSRDAETDTLRILERSEIRPERVVLHCFSSSREMLETGVAMGYYVSFSGMVTFRSFPAAELVPHVPDDRILAETDAPYLAPTPHRGRRNEPAFVIETVRALAELRGAGEAEMATLIRRNAHAFYRIAASEEST